MLGNNLPFGPFLWKTKVDTSIINLLINDIPTTKDVHSNNTAAIIQEERQFGDDYLNKYGNILSDKLNEYINEGHQYFSHHNINFHNLKEIQLKSMWVNIMRSGDSNPPHAHPGDLGFVIYCKVPQELVKENETWRGKGAGPGMIGFSYGEVNPLCITSYSFLPEEGDMYIFPATLKHYVNPYRSNVERVSVAGNLVFKYSKEYDYNLDDFVEIQ